MDNHGSHKEVHSIEVRADTAVSTLPCPKMQVKLNDRLYQVVTIKLSHCEAGWRICLESFITDSTQ